MKRSGADNRLFTNLCLLCEASGPVAEDWLVKMHGEGNGKCYQPCKDNLNVHLRVLDSVVVDVAIKDIESVNAETVDGG